MLFRSAIQRPFRYELMWERHENFQQTLDEVWRSSDASNIHELQQKLNYTTMRLSGWGSSAFGAVRKELRELRKRLLELRSDELRVGLGYEEKKIEVRIAELC